jgi:hypothetical protein
LSALFDVFIIADLVEIVKLRVCYGENILRVGIDKKVDTI